MTMLTVRTTIGREKNVIRSFHDKIKKEGYQIKAVVHPNELKGYIIAEGKEKDIRELVRETRHAKGILQKDVDIDDIKDFIIFKEIEIEIERGDTVEVIGGPFKGEKGKVTRVDKNKSEVTLELLEATVPIPVTVGVESVKQLDEEN